MGVGYAKDVPEPGLLARAEAVRLATVVLRHAAALDDAFDQSASGGNLSRLSARDRSFCYAIVATALRRKGEIDLILQDLITRPLPRSAGIAPEILLTAAAQILFMQVPPHAAVGMAVRIAKSDNHARHFAGLVNAVGRKLAMLDVRTDAPVDPSVNTPAWLYRNWVASYGEVTARSIALAHLAEPPIDLTVVGDPELWAGRLGGTVVIAQTVRLGGSRGLIVDLPGFFEGRWWVQDAAAAIPARLLGDVNGRRILDLCAAPGGKTAQLLTGGAQVTAVDRSPHKMTKLRDNLSRLKLSAEIVVSDVFEFQPAEGFDAVLLDAPCSATGIIRRHPDLPYHRRPEQISALADLQRRMLAKAALLVKPGGIVVFSTCSMEPAEGESHLENLPDNLRLAPLAKGEGLTEPDWLDRQGCIRTLPHQGLDGFFAMRLQRI